MSIGWATMMSTTRGKIKSEKTSEEGTARHSSAVQEIFNIWYIRFYHRTQMVIRTLCSFKLRSVNIFTDKLLKSFTLKLITFIGYLVQRLYKMLGNGC